MEVSIIIPIYNSERFIGECLQSILHQSFQDFELILVDDGSTDSSYSICKSYKDSDSRIHLVSKKNEGVSSARNCGLRYAKGKYIVFIDSDDYIAPEYLQTLLSKVNDTTDFVFSGMIDMSMGHIKKRITQREYVWRLDKEDDFIDFLYQPLQSSPCAKLYSHRIIKEHKVCFDTTLNCAEDRDFNLRFFDYIGYAVSTSYSGYFYRRDVEDSLTKRANPNAFKNRCIHWGIRQNLIEKRNFNSSKAYKRLVNDIYNNTYDEIVSLSSNGYSIKKTFHKCTEELSIVDFIYLKKWEKYIKAPYWQKTLLTNKCFFFLILINKLFLHGNKKG